MSGTTRIIGVGTVGVPVTDQDRALEFYVDKLGFEKRRDIPFGAGRADHADLQTRGVDVDPEVLRIPGAPPMFACATPTATA